MKILSIFVIYSKQVTYTTQTPSIKCFTECNDFNTNKVLFKIIITACNISFQHCAASIRISAFSWILKRLKKSSCCREKLNRLKFKAAANGKIQLLLSSYITLRSRLCVKIQFKTT
ncbi:hypothetical protein GJ496_011344 [Pomphorhynchus laevis]|nr:hypothetical protein GJ496_011344 [Pomphorhynchus laevis]